MEIILGLLIIAIGAIIRKTKKPFWKNENGKSGREEGKTKTESSPTRTQKKDSV